MASNACKLLCLVLSLAFVTQGFAFIWRDCNPNDLIVKQSKTGKLVQNKPEWEVRVTNPCKCRFEHVRLSCVGFNSVTPISSLVMYHINNNCYLGGVGSVTAHSDVVFKYVWDRSFDFKVLNADYRCP